MAIETVSFGRGIDVIVPSEKLRPDTALYIAGPQGFAEATRPFHESLVELIERMGGIPLDPWKLTPPQEVARVAQMPEGIEQIEAWKKLNISIGETNEAAMIKATGMIANLDGVDVDSGTATEIASARWLGIAVLGYRGDFRPAGDNLGAIVNLQVEHFLRKSRGGDIVRKIADLPQAMLKIWGQK